MGEVAAKPPERGTCLSLWERWPSIARTERELASPYGRGGGEADGEGKSHVEYTEKWSVSVRIRSIICFADTHPWARALSVTCGDSSPRGRAKSAESKYGNKYKKKVLASPFGRGGGEAAGEGTCLSLWERWRRSRRRGYLPLPLGEVAAKPPERAGAPRGGRIYSRMPKRVLAFWQVAAATSSGLWPLIWAIFWATRGT